LNGQNKQKIARTNVDDGKYCFQELGHGFEGSGGDILDFNATLIVGISSFGSGRSAVLDHGILNRPLEELAEISYVNWRPIVECVAYSLSKNFARSKNATPVRFESE
jgi:hypothetical protein